jgi:hypothetical protein
MSTPNEDQPCSCLLGALQVYISLATFSCTQAEGGQCACKGLQDNVGGNMCIYEPEPGLKIPTDRCAC